MRITFDMASRSVQLRSDSVSNVQLFIYRTHCNNYKYVKFFWPSALHVFVFVCLFVMRTQLDLIFWNKLAGRCSYSESTKYACLMCKSDFCVRRSVFENDENVAVWKKHKTGTTWKRNCDVALGISNKFNVNCIWSRLFLQATLPEGTCKKRKLFIPKNFSSTTQ